MYVLLNLRKGFWKGTITSGLHHTYSRVQTKATYFSRDFFQIPPGVFFQKPTYPKRYCGREGSKQASQQASKGWRVTATASHQASQPAGKQARTASKGGEEGQPASKHNPTQK
jgi:hypothetical protein